MSDSRNTQHQLNRISPSSAPALLTDKERISIHLPPHLSCCYFFSYSNEVLLASNLKTLKLFNLCPGILLVLVHTNFNYRLFGLVTRQATESITAESLNKVEPEITS